MVKGESIDIVAPDRNVEHRVKITGGTQAVTLPHALRGVGRLAIRLHASELEVIREKILHLRGAGGVGSVAATAVSFAPL